MGIHVRFVCDDERCTETRGFIVDGASWVSGILADLKLKGWAFTKKQRSKFTDCRCPKHAPKPETVDSV